MDVYKRKIEEIAQLKNDLRDERDKNDKLEAQLEQIQFDMEKEKSQKDCVSYL